MLIRELDREEIEKVRTIDRGEVIDNIFTHENGELVLKPEDIHFEYTLPKLTE